MRFLSFTVLVTFSSLELEDPSMFYSLIIERPEQDEGRTDWLLFLFFQYSDYGSWFSIRRCRGGTLQNRLGQARRVAVRVGRLR